MNAQPALLKSPELSGEKPLHNWNTAVCLDLIRQLWQLRRAMLARETSFQGIIDKVLPEHRQSARNLVHYLSLRGVDLRPLQDKLAWLGLSSLGRSESHVLANLDKVLGILHHLTGQPWQSKSADEPAGSVSSRELLQRHTTKLLGAALDSRPVRIMVTLPSQAANDYSVVHELVHAGMDVARINCAHDTPSDWRSMAANVHRAAKAAQRHVKVLMDLGGAKIRTGALPPQAPVLKLKPGKDALGQVFRPARLRLRPICAADDLNGVDASVGVWEVWLDRLKVGSKIDFVDARGAKRHMLVVHTDSNGAIAQCLQTAYLTPETIFYIDAGHSHKKHSTLVCQIEPQPSHLQLHRGETLRVTKQTPAALHASSEHDGLHNDSDVASIPCTLPEIFAQVQVGERIWFDDGRIGGVIRVVTTDWIDVEITHARDGGEKLTADKGINLPDSMLNLPALSAQDIEDLPVVAMEADMVGLSFVQKPEDVTALHQHLKRLKREDMGIVLKIETRQGFENLPELMLAAMTAKAAGVMIARGDLAIECGYERLAEVQEEILCCAEAAHMPVIWATQVLESLAKTGLPSRAEISDASLSVRAECVMLNKGPYIAQAIHTLIDILQRMGGHQSKKRPLLRALRSWNDSQQARLPNESSTNALTEPVSQA